MTSPHALSAILVSAALAAPAAAQPPPQATWPEAPPPEPAVEPPAPPVAEPAAAPIFFEFDSSAIDPEDAEAIAAASRWLNEHPDERLVIEGHTDEIGTETYNVGLALRRAAAVRDRLLELGHAPDRVIAVVYGEVAPESGRDAQNRRVVMYGTSMTPRQLVDRTLPVAYALVWE